MEIGHSFINEKKKIVAGFPQVKWPRLPVENYQTGQQSVSLCLPDICLDLHIFLTALTHSLAVSTLTCNWSIFHVPVKMEVWLSSKLVSSILHHQVFNLWSPLKICCHSVHRLPNEWIVGQDTLEGFQAHILPMTLEENKQKSTFCYFLLMQSKLNLVLTESSKLKGWEN